MARLGNIKIGQVKSWFANKRNRTMNTKPKRQKLEMQNSQMFGANDRAQQPFSSNNELSNSMEMKQGYNTGTPLQAIDQTPQSPAGPCQLLTIQTLDTRPLANFQQQFSLNTELYNNTGIKQCYATGTPLLGIGQPPHYPAVPHQQLTGQISKRRPLANIQLQSSSSSSTSSQIAISLQCQSSPAPYNELEEFGIPLPNASDMSQYYY